MNLPETPITKPPRLVILESPFAGAVDANVRYAKLALQDSLLRGEAPIASHLLWTRRGLLDDTNPVHRMHGMEAGLAWYRVAQCCAVYIDRGISSGMERGIARAKYFNVRIERRRLQDVPQLALGDPDA